MAALEIAHLSVAYQDVVALREANLAVPPGVIMGVVGPNGAGKSTLIKAALGLVPTRGGSVRVLGEPFARVRHRVGYLPQHSSIDRDYPATLLDVALLGTFDARRWWARTSRADRAAAHEALAAVGLDDLAHRSLGEVSGGQRQRALLARTLAHDADLYLMDEPFAGVDVASQDAITRVLRSLRAAGKTVVIVHHDLATIPELCDEVALIDGSVVAAGPVDEVFTRALIDRTYGLAGVRTTC